MSRKKKLQKEREQREIRKTRTVLADGKVVYGGRYLEQPDGTLRDIGPLVQMELWKRKQPNQQEKDNAAE